MTSTATFSDVSKLMRCARIPHLRALAWNGETLYASRRYELLRASAADLPRELNWQVVGNFRPSWNRRLSVVNRLTARLFRDGFHALALLPSGTIVAAVPGAIATLRANETEFRRTFSIVRGSRPLHITAVPSGRVFWGEYFDNATRDEVHIYGSADGGMCWDVAYTFPQRAIRHVHNIVHDPWQDCLWVLTGDYGDECRIIRASYDFTNVEVILQGKQQARAVAAVPTEDGLYFTSDTPLEQNFIHRLDRGGTLSCLAPLSSSSIYGCQIGSHLFFSTMVEPSEVNRDCMVRIYAAQANNPQRWESLLSWRKDRWPMKFFQYGNAFLPDGINPTQYLVVSTVAVESDRPRPGNIARCHGQTSILSPQCTFRSHRRRLGKKRIKSLAHSRGLTNVWFLDQQPREKIPSFISAADVCLVLLKKTDVFKTVIPTKMLEYMSCARAVILGVEGQARQILEDAGAGLAIEPENADALAAAITQLDHNREQAKTLGEQGRAYILQKFSRASTAQKYITVLRDIASTRR